MVTSVKTQGMTVGRGDGASPETYSDILGITSVQGPDGSAAEIDITALESTGKEFNMGLKDEGSVSLEIIFNPDDSEHTGLRTDRDNATLRSFRITFTNSPATTATFNAYVTNYSVSGQIDEVVRLSVTLRISGSVTWA